MDRLLIIADDLTGANETTVHFAGKGISTKVIVNQEDPLADNLDYQVMAVSTNSRHDDPEIAKIKVRKVIDSIKNSGFSHVYKKTDSALRGNIGAELEGLLNGSGFERIHFVPAHPAIGRSTRNGIQYIGEKLLHESDFSMDLLNPMTQSNVLEILAEQTNVPIRLWKSGDDYGNFKGILVYDASSISDLQQIFSLLKDQGELHLCAGPAGLAYLLPHHLSFTQDTKIEQHILQDRSITVINGSIHPVALSQVKKGLEKGMEAIKISPENLVTGNIPTRQNRDSVIFTIKDPDEISSYKDSGLDFMQNFAQIAAGVWREHYASVLCVFGGDTLLAILNHLGVNVLHPQYEILPGLVLCGFQYQGKEQYLISKPGSFGEEDILNKILNLTH